MLLLEIQYTNWKPHCPRGVSFLKIVIWPFSVSTAAFQSPAYKRPPPFFSQMQADESCRHRFKVLGFNPWVTWPGHSANGRARLRFQPKRREGNKEGGRERQALICAHDLDSQPVLTALLTLEPAGFDSTSCVFRSVWMAHFKDKGNPTTGESQRVCPGTEWGEEEGRQQQFFPLIFASAGFSSVGEWGQELWPSVWVGT